jgi:DNA sulfur modification protein DndD
MIFDELVLHNFGIYLGRQTINLAPGKPGKPVILIGALNGGGKTTFLDALRLVLYGRRAITSNRQDLAYDDYLLQCIHRGVDPSEGAALEIAFRLFSEGSEQSYRVHRSWMIKGKALRERVEVTTNGVFDPTLTETWSERVEEILPLKLSQFFFFDGEKLEALADIERSRELLKEAIHALLGLDLVDQLGADLRILERRQREQQLTPEAQLDVLPLKAEFERTDADVQSLLQARGEQSNVLTRCRADLQSAERAFAQSGGPLRERLAVLHAEKAQLAISLATFKVELIEAAEGAAPLLLLRDQVEALHNASAHAPVTAKALLSLLEERDAELLKQAVGIRGMLASHTQALEKLFKSDRARRAAKSASAKTTARLDPSIARGVAAELAKSEGNIRLILRQHGQAYARLTDIERELAQVPAEDAVQATREHLADCEKALYRAEATLQAMDENLTRLRAVRERAMAQYSSKLEQDVDRQHRNDVTLRLIDRAADIRDVLTSFRQRVAERHANRIAKLIAESFQHLHRKQGVVDRIEIDPTTFGMVIFGHDQKPLAPERLSAGERQLLAIGTIWAILRASGRPLPLVIDTPLGRLDSEHRQHLVERFFPRASHQTILLSTDTEIDTKELARLKPYVGHSYAITYDPKTRGSTISSGYFWEAAA